MLRNRELRKLSCLIVGRVLLATSAHHHHTLIPGAAGVLLIVGDCMRRGLEAAHVSTTLLLFLILLIVRLVLLKRILRRRGMVSIAVAGVAVGGQVWICGFCWQSLMVQRLCCVAGAATNVAIRISTADPTGVGVLERSLVVAESELPVSVFLLLLLLLAFSSQLSLLLIVH